MEATPIFDWPFPGGKEPPNGPLQIGDAVVAIEERLAILEKVIGTHAVAVAPEPGELIVVDGTSHPAYKAATGDVTINSAGVTTIGAAKITAAKVAALAIETAALAANAVETAKILNLAVTTAKLAALAVTAEKLAAEAVTEAKIADGAVTSRKYKPTIGRKVATGEANFPETVEGVEIPGLKLEITPAVASYLKVDIRVSIFIPEPNASAGIMAFLNGAQVYEAETGLSFTQAELDVTGFLLLELAAGVKSTLTIRGKRTVGASTPKNETTQSHFRYELIAR
jgi:hypothetical protein